MSEIGDQIIEALEEVLADAKGTGTGVRRHTVLPPQDGEAAITEGDPQPRHGREPAKRRA